MQCNAQSHEAEQAELAKGDIRTSTSSHVSKCIFVPASCGPVYDGRESQILRTDNFGTAHSSSGPSDDSLRQRNREEGLGVPPELSSGLQETRDDLVREGQGSEENHRNFSHVPAGLQEALANEVRLESVNAPKNR